MNIKRSLAVISLVLIMLLLISGSIQAEDQTAQVTQDAGISPTFFSLALFLVTVVIGIIAVLGGTGGGVLFTPIMMGFTPINSYIIRATGLFVALAGSLIAARPFLRKGLANTKLLLFAAVPYTIFAIIGALLAGYIQNTMGAAGNAIVSLALGCLVVLIALLVVIGGRKVEYPDIKKIDGLSEKLALGGAYWERSLGKVVNYKISRAPVGIILFCLVGAVSGLFGVGAGWAMVPVLNLAMFAPLKIAAASSKVLIGIGDTGAIWPYLMNGGVFPLFLIPSIVGVVVGTAIGARLMPLVKASFVRWLVIFVLFASGGKLVYDGLRIFVFHG
jgi:uncharacterized membrane protein YfcA